MGQAAQRSRRGIMSRELNEGEAAPGSRESNRLQRTGKGKTCAVKDGQKRGKKKKKKKWSKGGPQ